MTISEVSTSMLIVFFNGNELCEFTQDEVKAELELRRIFITKEL